MIVKNEEKCLEKCLRSLNNLVDEIIIVDTGSTDSTKTIAAKYTDKIYDFKWIDDFSAARNYSFSKATMDYIYVADADEVLDDENQKAFRDLKACMDTQVEIVQMKYKNDSADNNVQNSVLEYRPKLFKRVRSFTWVDPIHETVRLEPIVFDSDIVVNHCPIGIHSKRDFSIFEKHIRRGIGLSKRIRNMYARELLITGDAKDLQNASAYFSEIYQSPDSDINALKEAACVLARCYRLNNDSDEFFKYALKDMTANPCAEICCELGEYYFEKKDFLEASIWFYNAAFETECILNLHASGDIALWGLTKCYENLAKSSAGNDAKNYYDVFEKYKSMAEAWTLPSELD